MIAMLLTELHVHMCVSKLQYYEDAKSRLQIYEVDDL